MYKLKNKNNKKQTVQRLHSSLSHETGDGGKATKAHKNKKKKTI